MTLTCTINSVTVPVMWPFSTTKRINLRSTSTFTVPDANNTIAIAEDMAIAVSDSTRGTLFTGYVQSVEASKLPGSTTTLKTITCKNQRWLADKRLYVNADYTTDHLAGDIVCDLHANTLASEGVLATYVRDHDSDSTTWATGTHTGTTGASGELTISQAGSAVTISENTDAEWASATSLTDTTYSGDELTLATDYAIRYTGNCAVNLQSNLYTYRVIWSGTYTIAAGDVLVYDIFMSSTSPDFMGQVDLGFSDGTYLRDKNYSDSLGIKCSGATSLAQYATDEWYHREVPLTPTTNPLTGYVIHTCMVSLEGDKAGAYTYYIKNIRIYNGATLKETFYSGATLNKNYQINNAGYYGSQLVVVPVYADTGVRVSDAYSLSSAALAGNSLLSWIEHDATQVSSTSVASKRQQVTIESSIDDGATYQVCNNHQPIPGILAGMTLTGKTLLLRETLCLGGPSPEISPHLVNVTAVIQSAYAATKTDATLYARLQTEWDLGTYTNTVGADNQLYLDGFFEDWENGTTSDCILYTTDGSATMTNFVGTLSLRTAPSNEARGYFSFSPYPSDFVFEVDLQVPVDSGSQVGICYRTSYWGNNNNTFAYFCGIRTGGVILGKGTNTAGAGAWTQLGTNTVTLTAGDWHRLMVNVTGSVHTVYLNGVSMFAVTDGSFSGGNFGARFVNGSGVNRNSGYIDNFGVQSYLASGTWVSNALSLAAVGTVRSTSISWNESTPVGGNEGNTHVLVETSINGGSTYSACTNGGTIPGLTTGTNVSSVSVLVRITLTTQNYNATPIISGLSVMVVGYFNAIATRVSDALTLTSVGVCGSTSVYWTKATPTSTSVIVETTIDNGATWHTVSSPGDPIYGIIPTPNPTIDEFTANTSANYTTSGGTWTWDTTNSRLVGTVGGKLLYTAITSADGAISAIIDYADGAGLTARWTNSSNNYAAVFHDASASSPNTCQLYKTVSGSTTQVGASASISFTRGQFKKITLSCVGSTITLLVDDAVVMTRTDTDLTTGKYGFEVDNHGQFYAVWICPQGQNLSGVQVKSQVTLTSTDPLVVPTVPELTISARSRNIDSGSSIPSTAWQYQNMHGACIDDLAKRSNGWWHIRDDKQLFFQTRFAELAAWPAASSNSNDILAYSQPKVGYATTAYRNRQYITGGKKIVAIHEQRLGDGIRQSWDMSNPIAPNTVPVITVANATQTVGQQKDGTFQFYYTPNSNTISQDAAQIPPEDQAIVDITYSGTIDYIAMAEDTAQQTLIASYDGSTGIVESVESASNLSSDAMDALAQARIDQYAILVRSWAFDTRRDGLLPGTILYVHVPDVSLTDVPMLIDEITETLIEEQGNVKATYSVHCTEGPPAQHWTILFVPPT